MSTLRQKTISGMLWGGIERFSSQVVQFIVMIIMARLLTPHDYGVVGMLTIFIAISQTLIDSGFAQAIIRKKDRTEEDKSTMFFFNIALGLLIYILLYVCAPLIAKFYNEPLLTEVTRVLGLVLVANSFIIIQRAMLCIQLDFKTQAIVTTTAAVLSGLIGIGMALWGYGLWAIVWQQISYSAITAILFWMVCRWMPILTFSTTSFKEMFAFGSRLMISGLINTIYNNLYLLVIGKVFSAQDLGCYTRAHQFAEFPSSNITTIIQRVSYPVLCKIEDAEALAENYRKLIRLSSFIIFPLMVGLAAVSKPFVDFILTEKWDFVAPLLSIICLSMMWWPIHALNLNLLQVKGRSDLFLRLEIIKKCVGIAILCVTIPMGLYAMCIGSVISSLIALVINTFYTGKFIHVGFMVQMKDVCHTLLLSFAMGTAVFGITLKLNEIFPSWLTLMVSILTGIAIYGGCARVFKFKEYHEFVQLIWKKNL